MVDYSYCRNKLKENIEKIGKRDADKIKSGSNLYQIPLETELYNFLGLRESIPIKDIENRILKPSMENMDAWSCSFSYRIPEIKKKSERFLALEITINENKQQIEYKKTNESNKDIIGGSLVMKKEDRLDDIKFGIFKVQMKIGESVKHRELNLLDFTENEFNTIIDDLNDKFPILNSKKVHAWEIHNRLAYYFKKNNIILDDSSIKSISFYLDTIDDKSMRRLRQILGIKDGSYKKEVLVIALENIAGYLLTRPDIPYRLLVYRDEEPTRIDIVRDDNKVDLHLVKGNIKQEHKLLNFSNLLKNNNMNGVVELNYISIIQGIASNFEWNYSNPNSVEKFMVQAFKNDELLKFGIRGIYDVVVEGGKKHFRVMRIYKGPDITDLWWRIEFELLAQDVVDKNTKKNGGEAQMSKEVVEKKPRAKRKPKDVYVGKERADNWMRIAVEKDFKDGYKVIYKTDDDTKKIKKLMGIQGDKLNTKKNMFHALVEVIDIVNKGDYPYTLEKIRDGREIVAVKHHKKLSEVEVETKIKEVKEHKSKAQSVKKVKVEEVKVEEPKIEYETIHIIKFVANLVTKHTKNVEIEYGMFKKKKSKTSISESIQHWEEVITYYGEENRDDELVEARLKEMMNITSRNDVQVQITAEMLPNHKPYSILESKIIKFKRGE